MSDNTADIKVSVYCLAYNHGKYIRDALNGFVSQKTDFRYEVFVHDDASTDNTAEIIREYAEKYPDIIKPVFQTENQYSKGIGILKTYIFPLMSGKYVAVCEGDDYWCDKNKLQLQYEYMEAHPRCSLCVHNTKKISVNGDDLHILNNRGGHDADYTAEDIIKADGGGLFHTSSYMWRLEDKINQPEQFTMKSAGDFSTAIYLSTIGNVHYIDRIMSVYRVGDAGSWTVRLRKNKRKLLEHYYDIYEAMNKMNAYTEGKYEDAFKYITEKYECDELYVRGDLISILKNRTYRKWFSKKTFMTKLKLVIKWFLIKCRLYNKEDLTWTPPKK